MLFGCGSFHPGSDTSINIAGFCDKAIQAQMDKAEALGATDPDRPPTSCGRRSTSRSPTRRRGGAVQPEEHRLRLEAGRQLHVQRAVLLPGRPGLGAVTLRLGARPERVAVAVDELQAARPRASPAPSALSPWALARRRLLRNRLAMASLVVFALIVVACLAAPIYAHDVAHTDPFHSNVNGTTIVNGKTVPVLQQGGGASASARRRSARPGTSTTTSSARTARGATSMARLLYGGRNSLLIGVASALICCVLATIVAVAAGFFGGCVDSILSRLHGRRLGVPGLPAGDLDLVVALTAGSTSASSRCRAGSLWIPIGIIGIIYIPYVARPIRGQVLSVRQKEYVEAAIAQGASDWRLMRSEILPNVITTVIVFFPLDDRDDHAHRVGALVPLDRRAAAGGELGHDHQRRPGRALHAAGGRDRARASRSCSPCSALERLRRRPARRARPARQAARGKA